MNLDKISLSYRSQDVLSVSRVVWDALAVVEMPIFCSGNNKQRATSQQEAKQAVLVAEALFPLVALVGNRISKLFDLPALFHVTCDAPSPRLTTWFLNRCSPNAKNTICGKLAQPYNVSDLGICLRLCLWNDMLACAIQMHKIFHFSSSDIHAHEQLRDCCSSHPKSCFETAQWICQEFKLTNPNYLPQHVKANWKVCGI